MSANADINQRPDFDGVLVEIAAFVGAYELRTRFSESRCEEIMALCMNREKLESTAVHTFMNRLVSE